MAYGKKDNQQSRKRRKREERAEQAISKSKGKVVEDFERKPVTLEVEEEPTQTASPDNIQTTLDVNLAEMDGKVKGFGLFPQSAGSYPNDTVRIDLYNQADEYLGTNYRTSGYTIENKLGENTITLDIEKHIQELGYIAGRYRAVYKFHRNILGSGDGHKIVVQEISANGMELRVRPVYSAALDNSTFIEAFGNGLFELEKSKTITNLFLFKSAQLGVQVFDYVQDRFTIEDNPYSIIFKLRSPIPGDILVGDELWLAQQVSDDFETSLTIKPPSLVPPLKQIAGPNFEIFAKERTGISTNYKDKEDLVGTDSNVAFQIQDRLQSGSLVEGIDLNIDYRKFDNFIVYGSAEQRLRNFEYKIRLIESYTTRIAALTTDLNGLAGSAVSSSAAFVANINTNKAKRSALIGGFDGYEKYLYYESASYETSSFGEFYPSTWPKSTSTKPYTLYSYSSSNAQEWFAGVISSASLYDNNNIQSLKQATPAHIVEDAGNETYTRLVDVMGHYFDAILPYIKQSTFQNNRQESISEGLSKDLLYLIGQNFGFEFENGQSLDELWKYALGTDATGSVDTAYETTTELTMKGIWKRLINNLPYLLKTKGTERCIRAIITCFGIPDTMLRIREYGGHEGSFDKKSDYIFNRSYFSFIVGYNGQTSGLPAQQIKSPWRSMPNTTRMPETVELRVRMNDGETKDQTIMEVPGQWKIRAFKSGSGNHLGLFISGSGANTWATASLSSSLYDDQEGVYNAFHHIALRRENATDHSTDNQVYTLIEKVVNYDKVVRTVSCSLSINGTTSGSYNQRFLEVGELWIPGSGSYTLAQSHSMDLLSGSVQEFRYWGAPLQDAILDNHALSPTSFQGNTDEVFTGSTSSFDSLFWRLCLGSDNKKTLDDHYPATASFRSQHPDQTKGPGNNSTISASFYNVTSSAYIAVVEKNSLEWPDLGANRSISKKIRIDEVAAAGSTLYRNTSIERPLTDDNPPDSPRLGIFLSPSDEVNQDIAEQFGGISIDDFIGNPAHLKLDDYPDLQTLQFEYKRKYDKKNKPNEYIRLLQHYNAAMFKLIKKFVPYRANTQTGLVIEPLIIERSKESVRPPEIEEAHYTAELDLRNVFPPSGSVQDGHTEHNPEPNYVPEGSIGGDLSDYLIVSSSVPEVQYQGEDGAIPVTQSIHDSSFGPAVQEGEPLKPLKPLGGDGDELHVGEIDLGINGAGWDSRNNGSKYIYTTYFYTGSSAGSLTAVTGGRYDTWFPVQPAIMNSRFSQESSVGNPLYDTDIFAHKAFSQFYTASTEDQFTTAAVLQRNDWTKRFGLNISQSIFGTTSNNPLQTAYHWSIAGPDKTSASVGTGTGDGPYNGLNWFVEGGGGSPATGSVLLNAFFSEREGRDNTEDFRYRVSGVVRFNNGGSGTSATASLYFGGFSSAFTQEISSTSTAYHEIPFEYITRADGYDLGIKIAASEDGDDRFVAIDNVVVQPLNYGAEMQDFHLRAATGMMNARYNGCKLTSTDYNVDSNDTVDKGPVITVTVGGGKVLAAKPASQKGTFEIR